MMQPFIHSYSMFFVVFFSMFILAIVTDWVSRKYNLNRLRTEMSVSGDNHDHEALKRDVESLGSRLTRLENRVNNGST